MTLDTRDDRTLFFDLLPIFFRTSSFSFRIKVYTVPGQPVHEATRKVVLAGADGVVFVADSSPDQHEANRASWQNLIANLARVRARRMPIVVQYNKRDLPTAVPLEELRPVRRAEPADRRGLREGGRGRGADVLRAGRASAGTHLDRDLQLAGKLGIDAQAFRKRLWPSTSGRTDANG